MTGPGPADGSLLAFRSNRTGTSEIWSKDLVSGRLVNLTDNPKASVSMPLISHDGSRVAFQQREPLGTVARKRIPQGQEKRALYLVPSKGGSPEQICEDCGAPQTWWPDDSRLLFLRPQGNRTTIHLLDLATRRHRLWLEHPEFPIYVPRLSHDAKWLVCKADLDSRRTRLWVIPLRADNPTPVAEWIPVTEGQQWDDLPRWSTNDRTIYFTSNRDGFRCIWAQRLHPSSKRPVGDPYAVRHFHDLHLTMLSLSLAELQLSLARDKLVFPLAELRGNVWMMEPKP